MSEWRVRQGGFSASRAEVVIVVDVLRAFTTTRVLMEQGLEHVKLCRDYDEILELSRKGWLTLGERNGYALEHLSLGNSPAAAMRMARNDEPVALLTTNGVPAARQAKGVAKLAFATGLRGADHLPAFIAESEFRHVEVWTSDPTGVDDLAVANYLCSLANTGQADYDAACAEIRASPTAAKFLDPQQPDFDELDLEIALEPSTMGFVMTIVEHHDQLILKRQVL